MIRDKYIERFILLVLKSAPSFDAFSIFELKDSLNLTETEEREYEKLTFEIRKHLV